MVGQYETAKNYLEILRMALRNILFNCVRSSKARLAFRNFAKDTDNKFALEVVGRPVKDFNSINLKIGSRKNFEILGDAQTILK